MKNLLVVLGLAAAVYLLLIMPNSQAASVPGETAAAHAQAYALLERTSAKPDTTPDTQLRCNGTGYITHGDGHKSKCPGCQDCQKLSRGEQQISFEPGATALIRPANYERVTRVDNQNCTDGTCEVVEPADDCACTALEGACSCAPVTKTASRGSCSSGSCASGSCGAGQAGEGPVRKVFRAKPVRKVLGRLFRRRG